MFLALKKSFNGLWHSHTVGLLLIIIGTITTLSAGVFIAHELVFGTRIYPNLSLATTDLGMLSFAEAEKTLTGVTATFATEGFTFLYEAETFQTTPTELGIIVDNHALLEQVKRYGRHEWWLGDAQKKLELVFSKQSIEPAIEFIPGTAANAVFDQIGTKLDVPEVDASLVYGEEDWLILESKQGLRVDQQALTSAIKQAVLILKPTTINIPMMVTEPTVTAEMLEPLRAQAMQWTSQAIQLMDESGELRSVAPEELTTWISSAVNTQNQLILTFNTEVARQALWVWAEASYNQPLQNGVFEMSGSRVTNFVPSKNGRSINLDETLAAVDQALERSETAVTISSQVLEPEVKTGDANDLGIKELTATGTSYFTGSSWARIENIKVATSKLNGMIVMPGEVFSFNETVGDISSNTGFVEGLIISGNATVPGVGGGICQTSTTMFRAILNAGLPILERNQHSYRVRYYEVAGPGYESGSPGIDAAIYSPSLDLKFLNDTEHAILILTHFDGANKKLVYELYGTPTGRQVEISTPKVYNQRAAPPPVYFDDPTKPVDYLNQIDWAVAGAETEFTRTTTYPTGEVKTDTYHTNYRPWSAKYERGTMASEPEPVVAPTV